MSIEFAEGSHVLAPGRHPATVPEVEDALVKAFPSSQTRAPIFNEWNQLRDAMVAIVPLWEHWLDGSYVSKKVDPNDIDLCSHFDGPVFDALDSDAQARFNALANTEIATAPRCDSFVVGAYPEGHEAHATYVSLAEGWDSVFGSDRSGNPKGYIELRDTCLHSTTTN
jgi:hypothetical protein